VEKGLKGKNMWRKKVYKWREFRQSAKDYSADEKGEGIAEIGFLATSQNN